MPGALSKLFKKLLPMDEASRMARAAEQGFTTDAFHGAHWWDGGNVLNPTRYSPYEPQQFFSAKDPRHASDYAGTRNSARLGEEGNQVVPLRLNTTNYLDVDAEGMAWNEKVGTSGKTLNRFMVEWAEAEGKDGVVVRNVVDPAPNTSGQVRGPTTVYISTKPNTVRSRFAAFDPAKKDSADLLAAMIGAPVGAITASREQSPSGALSKVEK